ncbi:MAG TPA: tetratricopeptide repeat protein [Terriglobia bacterium]|nr:tetratricopeptide repeat protein [Terriglobia bacterium]
MFRAKAQLATLLLISALSAPPVGRATRPQVSGPVARPAAVAICGSDIATARGALAANPTGVNLELYLARALASCRQYSEAIARYRRVLSAHPQAGNVAVELANALFKAGEADEASGWFRQALFLNPSDPAAAIGLAQTLAAGGHYAEALLRYEQALRTQPENYDALEGKADILFWTGHLEPARALLQQLRARDPRDSEVTQALATLNRALRATQAAGAGRQPGASPAGMIALEQERLRSDPGDVGALEDLARAQAQRGDFRAAIAAYQQVVAGHPDDRGAQLQLARLLGWDQHYDEAARAFRAVLAQAPADREALEGLAGVQLRSGKLADADSTYSTLAAEHPSGADYLFEAARLEEQLHQYPAARGRLATLLALQPENADARLLLAQLELRQGQYTSSLRQFERVLRVRPGDFAARMGAAQARYYTGDLGKAYAEADRLVQQNPRDFDALFLLASIETGRGHPYEARALLRRADRLSHHNPEVAALREKLWTESSTVLHLSVGYTHETGNPADLGIPASLIDEDLRTLGLGSQLDFVWLPRSTSSLSFDIFPTQSPTEAPTAVVPGEFLYRQTTRITSRLTLRGGLGMERFGRSKPVNLTSQGGAFPQQSAMPTPVGFVGASFSPTTHVSADFTWSRSAIAYTPFAAWLGVISNRREGGLNFDLDPRTSVHLTYFRDALSTQPYWHEVNTIYSGQGYHPPLYNANNRQHGSGGTVVFNRRLLARERFAVNAGLSALALGYDGPRNGLYFGFFTPSFYQRDLLTSNFSGRLSSRVGYSFAAGLGVQQVNQRQPFKRAFTLAPSINLKVTPYVSTTLGYTHYDSTQALGIVTGNGVRLGIDWRF